MERKRPDGTVLAWTLTVAPSAAMPFLIDWGTSSHPALHCAEGLELCELRARHPDPGQLAHDLDAVGVTMGIEHGPEALIVELRGPLGTLEFG
jgi:hypothetical protein